MSCLRQTRSGTFTTMRDPCMAVTLVAFPSVEPTSEGHNFRSTSKSSSLSQFGDFLKDAIRLRKAGSKAIRTF